MLMKWKEVAGSRARRLRGLDGAGKEKRGDTGLKGEIADGGRGWQSERELDGMSFGFSQVKCPVASLDQECLPRAFIYSALRCE